MAESAAKTLVPIIFDDQRMSRPKEEAVVGGHAVRGPDVTPQIAQHENGRRTGWPKS